MGWWHSGVHVRLLVLVVLPGTGGVTILSVCWWSSGVHVRLLVMVVLPYRGSVWVGGVVEYMSDSWYWWFCHTEGQCGLVV